ncbi:MAG: hypothetical protein ACRCZD_00170 [Phycicoccus sp.]
MYYLCQTSTDARAVFELVVPVVPEPLARHRGPASTAAPAHRAPRTCSALALLLGGTLTSTAGPRVAYVVAGGSGLVVAVVAAVAVRRSVDARARREGTAASSERDRVGPRTRTPSR